MSGEPGDQGSSTLGKCPPALGFKSLTCEKGKSQVTREADLQAPFRSAILDSGPALTPVESAEDHVTHLDPDLLNGTQQQDLPGIRGMPHNRDSAPWGLRWHWDPRSFAEAAWQPCFHVVGIGLDPCVEVELAGCGGGFWGAVEASEYLGQLCSLMQCCRGLWEC